MPSYHEIVSKLRALPKERGVKIGQDTAVMRCQWHTIAGGKREDTASFLINLKKNGRYKAGSGRCFGCTKYVSDFRIICDPALEGTHAGVEDDADVRVEPLFDEKTNAILADEDIVIKLPNAIPWNASEAWRTINGKLLKHIGAKLIFEEEFQNLMAYLPCMVNGKHVGGVRANLVKRGKRNYFNIPGTWVKETGLFPYDTTAKIIKKMKWKTIVIVEGPRDALRCLQKGIPAVAILGTGNWSELKSDLIVNLGVEQVITALDGDKAGLRTTKKVYQSFKGELDVYNFDFRKYGQDLDPGNMPKKVTARLRSYIK